MTDKSINRRDFLQALGIGSFLMGTSFAAPQLIAKTANGEIVQSPQEYGGFQVEKLSKGKFPYKYKTDTLKSMKETNTVFSRNVWDPLRENRPRERISYLNLIKGKGKVPNQTRLDYAFMGAAWFSAGVDSYYQWHVTSFNVKGLGLTDMPPWDPRDLDMDWEDASLVVKHAGLFYGASLTGIAEMNPLWLYSDHFSYRKRGSVPVLSEGERFEQTEAAWYIPRSMNRVIALAFEEDYFGIANSPGRLASAAVGDGYSRMARTASTLAEFIRGLGYKALPAGNGIGPSIPVAIDAGLGQLGRNGLLITPKYGPRVRLAKVITNMPLIPDSPIDFGVVEFCERCLLCAKDCPSESISKGPQTWEGKSPSNNNGTFKWYIQPEPCYDFNGFSCSNCKRVCPFNKPNNSWLHKMIRQAIKSRIKPLNKVMVTFDQASGYGKQLEDRDFWEMDGQKCITSRESM
jgi:reductive dehalogenase